MTALAAFVCSLVTIVHWADDRNGDKKKLTDIIVLTCLAALLALGNHWLFHVPIPKSLVLAAGIHIGCFDYLIAWWYIKGRTLFKLKPIIEQPANKPKLHWFTYTKEWPAEDKRVHWDRLVAKVHPIIRLLLRTAVFGGSLTYFLL